MTIAVILLAIACAFLLGYGVMMTIVLFDFMGLFSGEEVKQARQRRQTLHEFRQILREAGEE